MLYQEKNSTSREFAAAFLEVRDARNSYAQAKGFADFYQMMLNTRFGLTAKQVDRDLERLQEACSPWIQHLESKMKAFVKSDSIPDYNYRYYWAAILKGSFPEFTGQTYENVKISIEKLFGKLGLMPEFRSTYIEDEPRPAKSQAGTIPSEQLPHSANNAYVFYDKSLMTIKNITDILHELFHGIHLASMNQLLPYILRKPLLGDEILSEMPAVFGEQYILDILFPGNPSVDMLDGYEAFSMLSQMTIWTNTLASLRLEKFIYDQSSSTIDDINQIYLQIKKELFPSIAEAPEGIYEWANNIYIWLYPVYTPGHFYAGMLAKQIRRYGEKKFGSIRNPRFIKWFKQKFLATGFSQDWQDLLLQATGKSFSPDYFFSDANSQLPKLEGSIFPLSQPKGL
ncbi:hypothetical protein A2954_02200 [Candidatus Roizmanbacteria bacterium RIFCSPLOWO2_01_FULL_37_12]|uniref:Peptidase M3A/M3B catalytic domain-containing protein n=1 Tax=Candidatus Roizmanbacteria bacterium RIFCSPLOWO2_01_FULL_37_12 TaxID=1802056 RepID=A0A1F7I897_9BACT|nr:MAG: hypothetical protein A2954_02200 [Candidatus Roizmanbacteria bacterium RIFCSPLOWO2_01_FULL_37_12]